MRSFDVDASLRLPELGLDPSWQTAITENDREWLECLGVIWPDEFEEEWLSDLNDVLEAGSVDVRYLHANQEADRENIYRARENFFTLTEAVAPAIEQHMESGKKLPALYRVVWNARILSSI